MYPYGSNRQIYVSKREQKPTAAYPNGYNGRDPCILIGTNDFAYEKKDEDGHCAA